MFERLTEVGCPLFEPQLSLFQKSSFLGSGPIGHSLTEWFSFFIGKCPIVPK